MTWGPWTPLAPENHASTAGTYGLGEQAYYGHVALQAGLTQTEFQNGLALSGHLGKVLNDTIRWKLLKTQVVSLVNNQFVNVPIDLTKYNFIFVKCKANNTLNKTGGNWGYVLAGPYGEMVSGSSSSASSGRVIGGYSGTGTANNISVDGGVISVLDYQSKSFRTLTGIKEFSGLETGNFSGVSISSYYLEGTATIEIYGLER